MSYRLRETVKGFCLLLIVVSLFTALAWFADQPDALTWAFRIGGPLVFVAGFATFLYVDRAKDIVPDHLYREFREFFDCGGFCFVLKAIGKGDICYFTVHFQNRHERACSARIIMRPTRRAFKAAEDMVLTCAVDCPGGAFGQTEIPVPVSASKQGRMQSFEITAGVEYPEGRGKTLWYRDGIFLRSRVSFNDNFRTALTVVAAMGGSLLIVKPASIEIGFPRDVCSELPKGMSATTTIHWVPET